MTRQQILFCSTGQRFAVFVFFSCGFVVFADFSCGFVSSIVAYGTRFPTEIWCDLSVFGHSELWFCDFYRSEYLRSFECHEKCRNVTDTLRFFLFFKSMYDFFEKNNEIKAVLLSILVLRFWQFF